MEDVFRESAFKFKFWRRSNSDKTSLREEYKRELLRKVVGKEII